MKRAFESGSIECLDHYQLLLVSNLAAKAQADSVTEIAASARVNNGRAGITGLLVFDGEHFAQLMEGPQAAVVALAERMKNDPRHDHMEVLHSGSTTSARRFPTWRLGYLRLNLEEFGPQQLRGKRGDAALEAFDFMLPALDMAVGDEVPGKLARRRP